MGKSPRQKIPIGLFPHARFFQRYLDLVSDVYEIHYISPKAYSEEELEYWVGFCKKNGIASVSNFTHEYAFFQALLNERLQAVAPSKTSCLYLVNKFLNRALEENPFWYHQVDLDQTDRQIAESIEGYPCMLKSTLFNLGSFIFKISNQQELEEKLREFRNPQQLNMLEERRSDYLRFCSEEEAPSDFPYFLVEKYIDIRSGVSQFSVDCYITADAEFHIFAARQEIYFPDFRKRGYICPAPALDHEQILVFEESLASVGSNLASKGYINQFFNVECWLTAEGGFHLTEINAIPNPHFIGMYAQMEGKEFLRVILDLHHQQINPDATQTPFQKLKRGELDKVYFQTEINCVTKGRARDIFDYDAIREIENTPDYHLKLWTEDEDFEFTDVHMSTPGWSVAEIYVAGDSTEEVMAKDEALRRRIEK